MLLTSSYRTTHDYKTAPKRRNVVVRGRHHLLKYGRHHVERLSPHPFQPKWREKKGEKRKGEQLFAECVL